MRRPSLRSQLNQIRLWVRQGRTDAWIAHALDISIDQLRTFKRDQGLDADPAPASPVPSADHAALLDGESWEAQQDEVGEADVAEAEEAVEAAEDDEALTVGDDLEEVEIPTRDIESRPSEPEPEVAGAAPGSDSRTERTEREEGEPRRRRRGRRGGRRRSARSADSFEATFEHGEEGYGLWLDPAVASSNVYEEHWAGHREVSVTLEPDAITIRRVEEDS